MCNEEATGTLDEIGQKDHSVTSEYRIFGPPGTGKTTNLTRQIRRAVDRYGPASVLVTSFSRAAATELIGRDLQTVAACLKRARFYVGNDSGVMHLSAALGAPTLGLFGPGYPDIYGPWGKNCAYVTTPESREELLSRLPNLAAREPNLMQSLSVERALAAAKELLARTA